ncbi:MAG: GAF domain-containing protein [Coriobacteriia bacterium]|nr:GAF domain-containing protein [Coriobacteriia bacterium]
MIEPFSFLPLFAAVTSFALTCAAATVPHRGSRLILWFIALNVSVTVWSLASFAQMNWGPYPDPALTPPEGPGHLLLWAYSIGLAGASAYWPLFAAAKARNRFWTSPAGIVMAHLPAAFTLVAATSNPWHHLFMRPLADGSVAGGPLAPVHYVAVTATASVGAWLVVTSSWSLGTKAGRRQAVALGAASGLPLAGVVATGVARVMDVPLPFSPAPVLFALLNAALAYEVVFRGYAHIVPMATFSSTLAGTRAPVAYLDAAFDILALSPSFARDAGLSERELLYANFFEAFPDFPRRDLFLQARATGDPVESHAGASPFSRPRSASDRRWIWSLAPVNDRGGVQGFVLSLSQVADSVRRRELEDILASLESDLPSPVPPRERLRHAAARAAEVLGCDSCCLVVGDGDGWSVMTGCEDPDACWAPFESKEHAQLAHVLHTREPFVSSDARRDDRLEAHAILRRGLCATLAVPLVRSGEPMGAVSFDMRSFPVEFTDTHLELARRLGSAMARTLGTRAAGETA